MYVVCPSCQRLFRAHGAHLAAAHGQVRCGACQAVFDATETLYDQPDEALAAVRRLRAHAGDIEALVGEALSDVGEARSTGASEADETPQALAARAYRADIDWFAHPAAAGVGAPPVPVPARGLLLEELPEAGGVSARAWWGLAASLLLVLLLAGQFAWAERGQLAHYPAVRPWLERFCTLLDCALPLRRDIARLEIMEREVRDHPRVPGALLISATFVNAAPFAQAYPAFEVAFSDVAGTPVAVRRFRPDEYMPAGYDASAGIAPGQRTHLVLEVLDPGRKAVSFQIEFL